MEVQLHTWTSALHGGKCPVARSQLSSLSGGQLVSVAEEEHPEPLRNRTPTVWLLASHNRTQPTAALNITEMFNKRFHDACFHTAYISTPQPEQRSRYSDWLRAERPRGRSSSPDRIKNFIFTTSSRLALGPTQPPIQWVSGALSPGVKRLGREADQSPPITAKVKKMWTYTSTLPYAFMV
jgi:hypothetical protein